MCVFTKSNPYLPSDVERRGIEHGGVHFKRLENVESQEDIKGETRNSLGNFLEDNHI